jgi:phage recombination protein Bet
MSTVSSFPVRERTILPAPPPLPDIPTKTILDYLDATGLSPELFEAEKTQFVSVCQAFGLNPFKREIYATVYGEGSYRRFSVIVGYETYLKRAERTGRLDGWSSRIEGSGNDMKAIVEIHRRDWSEPLVHEVYFVEAVQKKKDGTPTSFWTKMPRFQLKKVAISQGFRLCFPDELGGLPYDPSELPDAESLASAAPVPPTEGEQPQAAESSATLASAAATESPASIVPPAPEPLSVPSPTKNPEHSSDPRDRFPDESVETLLGRLEAFLNENFDALTDKHCEWILSQARKSRDRQGVLKMLGYAEKVVRNASAVASASA